MADEGLLIPIQFTLEEARAALAQLEAQARASGQRAGETLSGGFGKGLSGLKTGVSQAREGTMALTGVLSELGPQGRTAQIMLSSLGAMMMGGGLLGAGLLAAQAGVRLLVDAWEEEERASKKAADAAREAAAARAAANRELMAQANGSITSLQGMADALRETTAAEKAHREVLKINQQLALAQDPAFRRTLELRLAEAKAIETLIGKLEAEKLARESANKALSAQLSLQREQESRNRAAILAGELAWLGERERLRVEHERVLAGLSTPEAKQAEMERYWAADLAVMQRASAAKFQVAEQSRAEIAALTAAANASDLAQAEAHAARLRAVEEDTARKLQQMREESIRGLASGFVNMFGPVLTTSAAYNRAMRAAGGTAKNTADLSIAAFAAMTQGVLANLAQQAGVESLMELARAYAAYARYDPYAGSAHLTSAGVFGSVAGLAAAGAMAIGATRGMTAAEKASVAEANGQDTGGASVGGAREFGGGAGAGGTVTVRETIYVGVVANDFESPAETARRAARVMELVDRLDLKKREEG